MIRESFARRFVFLAAAIIVVNRGPVYGVFPFHPPADDIRVVLRFGRPLTAFLATRAVPRHRRVAVEGGVSGRDVPHPVDSRVPSGRHNPAGHDSARAVET